MAWILGIIASSVQKAYNSFSDNFNRTTSGLLGTSSSNGLWTALRGIWFANGVSAKSDDTANTYPISNINMTSENSTASMSTGQNTLIVASGTVGSIASGNGTTGVTGFHWATVTVTSTAGVNVGDWIYATNGTGSLYGGTPDFVEVTAVVANTSISYRIKGGTVPTAGTVTNIYTRGQDGGAGISLWITDSGNWFGVTYGRAVDTSCNCSQCLNGTYTCSTYGNSSYCAGYTSFCNSWASYTAWVINSDPVYGWRGYYSYGSGFSLYAYGLDGFVQNNYQGGTYSFCSSSTGSCTGGSYSTVVCTGSTQNSSPCNCQTCYPPYISVIKSVSNAVTEVTRFTLASMASAFKVVANGTTKILTIRPYRDTAMTTQIGADLTSDLSAIATPTKKFGIVLSPSDQIQGKNLDDFKIDIN